MKNNYILLCPHLQLKTESKSAPTTPSGHKNSSNRHHHHHHSSSHRDKDRSSSHHHRSERSSHHRSSDHHRRKRYNVGVQCKVGDKYNKTSSSSSSGSTNISAGYSLANPCPSLENSVKYKYGRFMRVETYPNGEGKVLHMWHDEISGLNEKEIEEVAKEFIEVSIKTLVWLETVYGRI